MPTGPHVGWKNAERRWSSATKINDNMMTVAFNALITDPDNDYAADLYYVFGLAIFVGVSMVFAAYFVKRVKH